MNSGLRKQRTLKKSVTFTGLGIHTGKKVTMRFVPSEAETGIVFQRMDLKNKPKIAASLANVCDTARSTTIGCGNAVVHTVEHVMAAIRAMQVDNLCIELSNLEPPVGNGSSDVFIEMIEEAQIEEQKKDQRVLKVKEPIYWSEGDISLIALPHSGFKVSYTLSYPGDTLLKCQFFSSEITSETFKKEIAPCRTFSLYDEVSMLMDAGLIKGGSLDNAVVINDGAAFSKEGLFFPDEMVRHKVLDLIGDLGLIGHDVQAHIIAIRSGHASNFAFAKKMWSRIHEA